MPGNILVIAGSDSGGGAGIQADLKTINNHGCFGTTAITAVTAQNSKAVTAIHAIPTDFIAKQITTVLTDFKISAVKIGMVGNLETLKEIQHTLKKAKLNIPIIFDPVMVATSGDKLLKETKKTIEFIRDEFLNFASIITPNIPEAEQLCSMKINNLDDMVIACNMLKKLGKANVLLKGGHLDDEMLHDVLQTSKHIKIYKSPKIKTQNTHGSGCSLASALACNLTDKTDYVEAVASARKYIYKAIQNSVKPGSGHGTLGNIRT